MRTQSQITIAATNAAGEGATTFEVTQGEWDMLAQNRMLSGQQTPEDHVRWVDGMLYCMGLRLVVK